VDLSSIKPVNSGTVSIADAIAKAKAIAAEKGVAYERSPSQYGADPRAGGRPYRQSRSRSRSPGRRDALRDNYNPYRDERRGDRPQTGREYGRERSFSPGVRGRGAPGTFSPPRAGAGYQARERSPLGRAAADDNMESISIESGLVGLIIGRQGENLRRVEAETGCRVQFITGPDETGPYRQCKITGPRARRAEAKAEINRIIEDSGISGGTRQADRGRDAAPARANSHQPALRDGEDSMQIMVPDRTVGLIIGRGGETIRDLQERSGCHVNIVGEQKSVNGLRPVNLIGSHEAATRAKDLIMEIVESDSKAVAGKDRPAQRDAGRDAGFGAFGGAGGDKINDSIFVPSEAVGMIIGKGGETIKDMQNTTGCKINVSPSSGPGEVEREIGLVGSRDSIEQAKRAIEDKVDAVVSSLFGCMHSMVTNGLIANEERR
jgi:far upstream element-binding protein